jgi:RNA polymerase sigma-70 factor (ECF subfamily)
MTEIMPPEHFNLQALFSAHQVELIRHVAKIVKCEETAADLTQESYLILSQAAQTQIIQHPRGFLFRVAGNLAFNHLRRNKMVEANAPHLLTDDLETPSAEHLVAQQQRLERFLKIIDELPPRRRDVFILHKVHGMSHKEIAGELGITVSGVEKHITKGLSFCRLKFLALEEE